MSILPQVPEKMQTILQTVADEAADRVREKKPQTHGQCVSPNARLRVVRTSRGKLSATHRNRCPARYTSQPASP